MELIGRDLASNCPLKVAVHGQTIIRVDWLPESQDPELPYFAPGLLDIQVNGYGGRWFSSERLTVDDVHEIVLNLFRRGVATCFPTLITNSTAALEHGLRVIREACRRDACVGAIVRGVHLEGPWISPQDGARGAHPLCHVRAADTAELRQLHSASGGLLRLLTVAPEVAGCADLIRTAAGLGLTVAIGHTAATREEIRAAIDAGARLSTHLGNAVPGQINRHHNPLWPQLADDRLSVSVISDGHHLPDDLLTCIVRCKSLARLIVTCDVSGFAGCAPGVHQHDGVDAEVMADGRILAVGQPGFLAGSGVTTLDCLPRLHQVARCSPGELWPTVAGNPHALTGLAVPRIQPGAEATLNLLRLVRRGDGSVAQIHPVRTMSCGMSVAAPDQESAGSEAAGREDNL